MICVDFVMVRKQFHWINAVLDQCGEVGLFSSSHPVNLRKFVWRWYKNDMKYFIATSFAAVLIWDTSDQISLLCHTVEWVIFQKKEAAQICASHIGQQFQDTDRCWEGLISGVVVSPFLTQTFLLQCREISAVPVAATRHL